MTKQILKFAIAALVLGAACTAASCGSDSKDPEWEWPDPSQPETEKPRFIWVDAAANFPDFADSRENIARDLALAKDAGFTDIVVDVRPTTGDVLFRTDKVDQVKWLGAWLPGGYQKVERTATWDYLQAFIDEGGKLGLRIHAAINTFTGGNATSIGDAGLLFRDASKREWATELNLEQGIVNILSTGQSAKFFNPVRDDVQEYICSLLSDLAAYEGLEGIFLDRGRFDGFTSDFSAYTRAKFEEYIGQKVQRFPSDILPAGHTAGVPSPQPVYFRKWLEFRAKVIHDFMGKARAAVKKVNPDLKFGVYVGGWYSTYYDVGVNWASPNYNVASKFPTWATAQYQNYGYADLMDQMLIGAYASPGSVYGTGEWSMQGFCSLAKERTMKDCPMVAGGPDVGNWDAQNKFTQEQENNAITQSVPACYRACDGYFLFDMIHLKKAGQWQYVKAGIDQVLNKK
ncbi:MAG: family 10 glycosylhydrolase [Alistipes senegalensis]|nr:family 10 glycosylhydrolase [Bacteroides cellulosilyticus]MCM1351867.1 family 10 glycosylhydrolase [Alistipes senegalensis]